MDKDLWHFERDELARRILTVLIDGPATALTLFAPGRTGKTEFLLHDLAPLAASRGHRVVYVSFWQSPLTPLAMLLHALEASLRRGRWSDRLRSGTLALAPRLTLSASLPGFDGATGIDLTALDGEPPGELLLHLDDLLERVASGRRPTLLLMDEVQELARDVRNRALVTTLRTALDTRRRSIRTVFTGSSQSGLRAMFSRREAPFFHFATPLDLPPLERAFVEHLVGVFSRITGKGLDVEEAMSTFARLHASPRVFRLVMEALVLDPTLALSAATRRVQERLAVDLGFVDTWMALDALQRALVRALAHGTARPFGKAEREALGAALEGPAPSSSRIQGALRRLERLGVIDRWDERWQVADAAFADWARDTATL